MATILVTATGYKNFIKDMRAAFTAAAPLIAAYRRANGTYTHFHYTVVPAAGGAPANLYLTSVSTGAAAAPAHADPVRPITAQEAAYGNAAIGNINAQTLTTALNAAPPGPGANFNAYKASFDVVLLCTVEAARSAVIYTRVLGVITNLAATTPGDELKDLAQMYGHTQAAAGVHAFRALDGKDYSAYYKQLTAPGQNVAVPAVLKTVAMQS
jgi:hypothetical protein